MAEAGLGSGRRQKLAQSNATPHGVLCWDDAKRSVRPTELDPNDLLSWRTLRSIKNWGRGWFAIREREGGTEERGEMDSGRGEEVASA